MSLELNKEFKLEMKRQKRELSSEQSLQNLTKEKLTFTYSYHIKSIELKICYLKALKNRLFCKLLKLLNT